MDCAVPIWIRGNCVKTHTYYRYNSSHPIQNTKNNYYKALTNVPWLVRMNPIYKDLKLSSVKFSI